jgi:hypothetical protein
MIKKLNKFTRTKQWHNDSSGGNRPAKKVATTKAEAVAPGSDSSKSNSRFSVVASKKISTIHRTSHKSKTSHKKRRERATVLSLLWV